MFVSLLREKERLAEMPFPVEMRDIQACVAAVYSPTAEDNPGPVRGPAVITFSVGAVEFFGRTEIPGLKIHKIQICLPMPDGKSPVSGFCEKKPLAADSRDC